MRCRWMLRRSGRSTTKIGGRFRGYHGSAVRSALGFLRELLPAIGLGRGCGWRMVQLGIHLQEIVEQVLKLGDGAVEFG